MASSWHLQITCTNMLNKYSNTHDKITFAVVLTCMENVQWGGQNLTPVFILKRKITSHKLTDENYNTHILQQLTSAHWASSIDVRFHASSGQIPPLILLSMFSAHILIFLQCKCNIRELSHYDVCDSKQHFPHSIL